MNLFTVYINPDYGLCENNLVKYFDSVEAIIDHLLHLYRNVNKTWEYVTVEAKTNREESTGAQICLHNGINREPQNNAIFHFYQEEVDTSKEDVTVYTRENMTMSLNKETPQFVDGSVTEFPLIKTPLGHYYECHMKFRDGFFRDITYDLNFTDIQAAIKGYIGIVAGNLGIGTLLYEHRIISDEYKFEIWNKDKKDTVYTVTYHKRLLDHYTDAKGVLTAQDNKRYRFNPVDKFIDNTVESYNPLKAGEVSAYDCICGIFNDEIKLGIQESTPCFRDMESLIAYFSKVVEELYPGVIFRAEVQLGLSGDVNFMLGDGRLIIVHTFIREPSFKRVKAINNQRRVEIIPVSDKVTEIPTLAKIDDKVTEWPYPIFSGHYMVDYGFGYSNENPIFYFTGFPAASLFFRRQIAYAHDSSMDRFTFRERHNGESEHFLDIIDRMNGHEYKVIIKQIETPRYEDTDGRTIYALDTDMQFRKVILPRATPREERMMSNMKEFKIPAHSDVADKSKRLSSHRICSEVLAICSYSTDYEVFNSKRDMFRFSTYEEMDMIIRSHLAELYSLSSLERVKVDKVFSSVAGTNISRYTVKLDGRNGADPSFDFLAYTTTAYPIPKNLIGMK